MRFFGGGKILDQVLKELKDLKGKKIALQVPEGLKHKIPEIVDFLRRNENDVCVFVDPTYGACDIRDHEAKLLGADLLVHIGHAPFPGIQTEIPVKYVELHLPVDVAAVVSALERIEGKIALCATVQYVHALSEIARRLKRVVIGKGIRTKYPGQILGCDAGACKVPADVNVVLADGFFHAIAAYMETRRRTYVVSPEGELKDVTNECEMFLKRRKGLLLKAYEGERWAIVISTKKGQFFPKLAQEIAKRAEQVGKRTFLIICDYFRPEYVTGIGADVFVFTGCPRVAIDDWKLFPAPVITAAEALEVIKWLSGRNK